MTAQLHNNTFDTLASSIDNTQTSIEVTGGDIPSVISGDYIPIYVIRSSDNAFEIMHVTSVSGNTVTVDRAAESPGDSPLTFNSGDRIEIRPTRQSLLEMIDLGENQVESITGSQSIVDALDSRVIYVDTIDNMKGLPSDRLVSGQRISVTTTGRAGDFVILTGDYSSEISSDPLSGIWVPFADNSGNTVVAMRQYNRWGIGLSPEMFGAVGDGAADDTDAVKSALDKMVGVYGTKGSIYSVNDTLEVFCELALNGSTIRFDVDGTKLCMLPKSGAHVHGGSVVVNGTNASGGGQYQCPILVGDYDSGAGYSGIKLNSLVIDTNRDNGNGIFVTGDSSGIDIDDIVFPDNSLIGRPILLHWGGATNPSAGTFHPHNISISNIRAGSLSATHGDGALVFLSAVYDVEVTGVEAESISLAQGLFGVFAGDYGGYYAGQDLKPLIMRGIKLKKSSSKNTAGKGVRVDCRSTLDPENSIYPGPILEQISSVGTGDDQGFAINNVIGGAAIDCMAKGHSTGMAVGERCRDFEISGGDYFLNQFHGINVGDTANPPMRIKAVQVRSSRNGQVGSGNYAGVYFGKCVDCAFHENYMGDASVVETQFYGLRASSDCENLSVKENTVQAGASGGVAYSLGSSDTYGVASQFSDNEASSSVTYQSGIDIVPMYKTGVGSNVITVYAGSGAPSSANFVAKRGDVIMRIPASAGGKAGEICVSSGSPGTWKAYGDIDA